MKEGFTIIEHLELPSESNSIVEIEKLIEKVCFNLGVQEDAYGNVLIAVTEAVNNAIQHGNDFNSSLIVDVAVGDKDSDFCFRIKDEGIGFDYNSLPDPTAPENLLKESGRGIFLMRNLADEVEFDGVGNSVNIYFSK